MNGGDELGEPPADEPVEVLRTSDQKG